ncbi:MAG: Uma2 family endonuclease [Alphaproteobacteria bacterium]|jgi:Uma2 family endonuclease|nr:Uma2 family endonuclease [Alphaproteobacteria bacterium]
MADAALKPMTIEEFFDWCPKDDRHWQLIDGRPVAMAPTSRTHAIIVGNLATEIGAALKARGRCTMEPGVGIVPPDRNDSWYEADLVVSCAPAEHGQRYAPEPVLIVEILSPSTEREDRTVKLPDYRRIPSVEEILLVDQQRPRIEVHRRTVDDMWSVELLDGMAASLCLTSISLTTDLAAVYANVAFPRRPAPEVP